MREITVESIMSEAFNNHLIRPSLDLIYNAFFQLGNEICVQYNKLTNQDWNWYKIEYSNKKYCPSG